MIHADEEGEGGTGKKRVETFAVGKGVERGERAVWVVEGGKFKGSFLVDGDGEEGLLISEVSGEMLSVAAVGGGIEDVERWTGTWESNGADVQTQTDSDPRFRVLRPRFPHRRTLQGAGDGGAGGAAGVVTKKGTAAGG